MQQIVPAALGQPDRRLGGKTQRGQPGQRFGQRQHRRRQAVPRPRVAFEKLRDRPGGAGGGDLAEPGLAGRQAPVLTAASPTAGSPDSQSAVRGTSHKHRDAAREAAPHLVCNDNALLACVRLRWGIARRRSRSSAAANCQEVSEII